MFELKTSHDIKNELEQITYNNMCCYTGYYNKQQIIITFNDGNGNTFNKIYHIPSKKLYNYFKRCLRKINNKELFNIASGY